MPCQRLGIRSLLRIGREFYLLSIQRVIVLSIFKLFANPAADRETQVWANRDVPGIEQAVNVAPQE